MKRSNSTSERPGRALALDAFEVAEVFEVCLRSCRVEQRLG